MKIYTSYFANLAKLKKAGIVPVGIAIYQPKWFVGFNYKVVAPRYNMISQGYPQDQYVREYKNILSTLSPKRVVDDLQRISGGKDIALLCYEKPSDFCHRHLLAEWLNNNGYSVSEFSEVVEPKVEKPKVVELTLF